MEFGRNRYIKLHVIYSNLRLSRVRVGLVAVTTLLLLLGGNAAMADTMGATTQPISFTVGSIANPAGTVVNLGDQKYTVSGGSVVTAMVNGQTVDPGSATLKFSMNAEVKGLSTTGNANFNLQGTIVGQPVSVTGQFSISKKLTIVGASVLPGPTGVCAGKAAKSCSELPTFFVGIAKVEETMGGSSQSLRTTMELENPYFNPFGMPILLTSADGSIFIIATYSVGTILWTGSDVEGPITGTLGAVASATSASTTPPTPISGTLSLNSTELENLVTGTAVDHGAIALDSMTPSSLTTPDQPGSYTGTSMIPLPAPGSDCSTMFGLPAGTGICTATGFNSMGHFTVMGSPQNGQQVTIAGQYTTTWTVPALAFSSVVSGTVTTQASNADR
jgi:hypothetical protein